jgi:hypothetical protein
MYKMSQPQQPILVFIPVLYSFVGLLLIALVLVHCITGIPFAQFTADPAATFNYNSLFGCISNIGILLWCAAASVCFLSAAILNVRRDQGEMVKFLVCFGALTAVLMFDDLFMFHESIAPWYLHVPEKAVLILYGLYALYAFSHFRKIVLTNDIRFLVLAACAFGSSVLIDQISEIYYIPGEYLFEDGAKFVGIASWLAYFVDLSFHKVMVVMLGASMTTGRGRPSKTPRNREYMYN